MSGGEIEQDIILDADGGPVFRAFDQIEARMRTIQAQVDSILGRAKAAAEAFGGANLKTVRDLDKVMGTLDKFDATIKKNSPALQSDTAWKQRQKQLEDEAKAQRKIAEDKDKAYAEMDRRERTRILDRTRIEQEEDNRRRRAMMDDSQKQERLAEQRIATAQAGQLRLDRERDASIRSEARQREQNNVKMMRDVARQQVEEARGVRELETLRASSAANINALRARSQTGTEEERRRVFQMLDIERQRLALVEARLRAENTAATKEATGTANLDGRLNVRTGRIDERQLAAQLDLNAATIRRGDIEARINVLIDQARAGTLKERLEAERSLKVEEARLEVINKRVRQLESEAAAAARAQARETTVAAPPQPPRIFGATGLTGVVARTAAYGGAAQILFGIQNAALNGAQFVVELDDALAKLASIANATSPELAQLKQDILAIGESSRFSLTDLVDMAEKLAQAGVSVSGMKEALKAVSTLANASGSTPAEAVDLVTASLGAFQLQGSEAARIADLMTSALNRTRLTVNQAALAIQYVGTTAYEQNISLEQLLATAGALSQAGIRSGSTIGTGMRQFLVDLQTPSEKLTEQFKRLNISMEDVDITTRGLPAVIETLSQKGFNASQAYGALETRAAAFYLVAKNNLPLMAELQMSFADQGAAAIANERAMNSLSAQWQRFKNILAEDFDSTASGMLTGAKNLLIQISDIMERMHRDAEQYAQQSNSANAPWYRKNLEPYLEAGFEATLNGPQIGNVAGGSTGGLGTWLRNLGRESGDATGKQQELEAAMNRTSQAANEQRDTVGALDHEILRLITQKEALRGKTQQVTAETVTLMSRFDGLSKHITGATGDINGLIGALQALQREQSQTLMDDISAQAGALQLRAQDAAVSRNSAVSQIRGDGGLMNALGVQGRSALNQLSGPNGRVAADILLRVAHQLEQTNLNWAHLVTAAANNQQTIFSTQGQQNTLMTERGMLEAQNTRYGSEVKNGLDEITGALTRLRSSSGDDRGKQSGQLTHLLSSLETGIKAMMGRNIRPNDKLYLQNALAEIISDRQQMSDILTPSKAQDRALDKQAQMITFGSPVRGTPRITSGIGHRASPGGIGSTEHQGIDIAGAAGDPVYAAADGVVEFAGPRGGYGNLIIIDHGMNTTTRYGHLSVIDVTVGQEVTRGEKIGRVGMTGTATGPHLHFERRLGKKIDRNPLSAQAPGSTADISDRAQRLQDKEENRAEREAVARERLGLTNADDALNDALKNMKYATTDELFAAGEKQVDAAFGVWADQLRKTTKAELDRGDATPAEADARMKEVEKTIKQRREEVTTSVFDYFTKSISKALELIEQHFKQATEPFELGLAMAQGRLSSLSRPSLQGKVPDYVQQNAERQVGVATEQLDRARSIALGEKIAETQQLLNQKTSDFLAKKDVLNPGQIAEATKQLQDLGIALVDLQKDKAQLDASLGTDGVIPRSFGENLQAAIANYRELHQLTASWTDMISMNLTDALGTAQGALEQFMTEATDGTTGVVGAFRNMVGNILKYLQQLIVKMIAVKIMQAALSLFGGPNAALQAKSIYPVVGGVDPLAPHLYGGLQIHALAGRYIQDGVPNRDSVNAKIAKGEYVTRKWAVDSVGVDFMEKLNTRGVAALRDFGPKVVLPAPAQQKMNVYVVQQDQQPTLGPNDVLVTIANDIYRGGPTKQLIRQVAQGG